MEFAFSLGPWLCVPAFRQVCPLVNIHFPNNKYSTTALVLQSYIKNNIKTFEQIQHFFIFFSIISLYLYRLFVFQLKFNALPIFHVNCALQECVVMQ